MEHNQRARKLLLQIVNNQIRMNNPPETKQTVERLVSEGYTKDEAKEMIAGVLVVQIHTIMKNVTEFDEELYITQLKNLPQSPFDE